MSSTKETFLDLFPAEVMISTNDTRRDLLPDGTDRFRRMSSGDDAGGDKLENDFKLQNCELSRARNLFIFGFETRLSRSVESCSAL